MRDKEKDTAGVNEKPRSRKKTLKLDNGDKGVQSRGKVYDEKSLLAQKKKTKIRRIIVFAIAEVIVLSMIFMYAYALNQYSKIQRPVVDKQEVKNNDLAVESIKRMEGYKTVAIFGVDSRDNSVGKGWNSDVIMIASVNLANGEVKLVSIYRDTYLNLGNDKYSKINHAYATGGPELALKAINKNLDLNITEYATFNWRAVATGINILGGVDIDLTKGEHKYINSYITETVKSTGIGSVHIKSPGVHHLDGVQAVAYGRLRYMDSDLARTERQRKIIGLALDKAKKADLKTLNDLLGNMLEMVGTNLTWQDGLDAIADINTYHIADTMGFPSAQGVANMGSRGQCIIPQTLESNVKALHEFLFADEDYQVSETVKRISNRIAGDTGMYKEGRNVNNAEKNKGNTSGNDSEKESSEEKENAQKSSKDGTKKKITPEYGVHYETDAAGETIWLYETDANGNPFGPEDDNLPTETLKPMNETEPGPGNPTESGGNKKTAEQSGATKNKTVGTDNPAAGTDTQPSSSRSQENATSQKSGGQSSSAQGSSAPSTTASDKPKPSTTAENKPEASSKSPGGNPSTGTSATTPTTTSAPTTAPAPPAGGGPGGEDVLIGEPKP